MGVEFTSEELRLEADTVPSASEHEFLVEGIVNHKHKIITEVQVKIHNYVLDLEAELEKARKEKTLGVNKMEKAIIAKLQKAGEWRDRAINSIEQEAEEALRNLSLWENRKEL